MPPGSLDKPGESEITRNDTDAIPEVDVTPEMLSGTHEDPETWLLYGGGYRNQRHTTADVITPDNVGDLQEEWRVNLGQRPGEYQGSPIIVPGDPPIMYQTNGPDHFRAMNARTGDILWHYQYSPNSEIGDPPANRGVTVLGDRVYITTLDMGIAALDRYTAEELWYYNQAAEYRDEQVENPATEVHEETVFVRNVGFSSSIPPIYWEGQLLKGSFGGEYGVSGWIDAVDTEGNSAWRVDATPQDEWVGDAWRHGGSPVWQPPAIDPETGTAVFPMGNPGPDFDATVRPGWNPYSTGKLALDAESGEYKWHYQESPHDWWDYDSPSPAVIFDDGDQTLATWAGKAGWVFTMDVETGELVERSQGFVQHMNMWQLPTFEDVEGAMWSAPSLIGGTDPQPSAYDPDSGLLIVKGANLPWKLSWTKTEYQQSQLYWSLEGFQFASAEAFPEGWNANAGVIAGVDPVSGEVVWQNWHSLPVWGSSMTTATGLTFAGAPEGQFLALDTATGEELWSADLGVGVGGDPVSWYDPGTEKQYVAIQGGGEGPAGGYGEKGDLLVVYSLQAEESTPTPTESMETTAGGDGGGDGDTTETGGQPGFGLLSGLAGAGAAAAGYLKRRGGGGGDSDGE
ncbi:MAG TPA: PQQ-binding-like beta-propeller repeat protein [Halobacteriales archaeon]|nr:PQQ-binding-like beta-propeller repeat protein [Halobacteriales archaeon]